MAYLPPQAFEIPRPPLEPPLHGLLDTAYTPDLSNVPEEDKNRWEGGISFASNPASCDHVTPWMSGTDDPDDKADPGPATPFSTYRSFVLTYSTRCMVTAASTLDDNVKAAEEALVVGSGQAVEAILWGPGAGSPLAELFDEEGENFSLTGSTPLVTGAPGDCIGILNQGGAGGGAVALTPKEALQALTKALGRCAIGARGFIHASVDLAEDWAGQSLITLSDPKDPESKLITNVRGDYVVGGSGYSGAGPAGHALATPAAGHAWAYATGPVGVLLSDPVAKETSLVDNRTNLHRVLVERTAAIAVNSTCLFAVYVDMT